MVFRVPCLSLATSPTDIEHDLVVIPGIIKRRDIDLSPPVGEWPLFAHLRHGATSRMDVKQKLRIVLCTPTTLDSAYRDHLEGTKVQSKAVILLASIRKRPY